LKRQHPPARRALVTLQGRNTEPVHEALNGGWTAFRNFIIAEIGIA